MEWAGTGTHSTVQMLLIREAQERAPAEEPLTGVENEGLPRGHFKTCQGRVRGLDRLEQTRGPMVTPVV
jgi:hypothetical protein